MPSETHSHSHMSEHAPSPEQDQKLEAAMGHMLRSGVLLSALIVLIGGVLYLRHPSAPPPDYATFHATAAQHRSIPGVLTAVRRGESTAIIQLGMLVLIATPVGRVVFAVVGFAAERDWLYTVVSCIVLAVLLFSFLHMTG